MVTSFCLSEEAGVDSPYLASASGGLWHWGVLSHRSSEQRGAVKEDPLPEE